MELHSDFRITSSGGPLAKKGQAKKFRSPHHLKSPSHLNTNGKVHMSPLDHKPKITNGTPKGSSSVSFSTNSNSVVCLPLVSEGLKLVWTQSDQTKELDSIPELVQAFNVFPYPTSQEVSSLAQNCGLTLDKVKVWFMVQRIKYGISWASEDIEETRCKLASPEPVSESGHKEKKKGKTHGCANLKEIEENDHTVDSMHNSPHKKQKKDPPELATYLTSPLSLQNSVNSCPVDIPVAETPSAASSSSSILESSLRSPQKHGRYKKSKDQIAALRKSFLQENWPSETELQRLQQETKLTRNEIRKWFSDSRYQLRAGRAMPGLIAPISQGECEPPQLQPLSLVTEKQKSSVTVKGGARSKKAQKTLSRSSHFFQAFLSNTLEAFGEGEVAQSETELSKEDDDIPNDDEEVGSEHDSETHETEVVSEAVSKATSSSLTPKSPQTTVSKSSKKSPHVSKAAGGRMRKTKEQLDILKDYFLRSPWPKGDELTQLGELTTLPRADITQWFGDTRYAVKNGQLRWVSGAVREHILSEIGAQHNLSGGAESSSTSGTPKSEGSRKRKSNSSSSASKVPKSGSDSIQIHPLEVYHRQTGALQEKDLDALCRKSKMSYQQVRDWFAAKDSSPQDLEHSSTDD